MATGADQIGASVIALDVMYKDEAGGLVTPSCSSTVIIEILTFYPITRIYWSLNWPQAVHLACTPEKFCPGTILNLLPLKVRHN